MAVVHAPPHRQGTPPGNTHDHVDAEPPRLPTGFVGMAALTIVILDLHRSARVRPRGIRPQHRRGDRFELRLLKNSNRTSVALEIPVHLMFEAALACIRSGHEAFTIKDLGNRASDCFSRAGLLHCAAQTVRKALAT